MKNNESAFSEVLKFKMSSKFKLVLDGLNSLLCLRHGLCSLNIQNLEDLRAVCSHAGMLYNDYSACDEFSMDDLYLFEFLKSVLKPIFLKMRSWLDKRFSFQGPQRVLEDLQRLQDQLRASVLLSESDLEWHRKRSQRNGQWRVLSQECDPSCSCRDCHAGSGHVERCAY